MNFVPIRKLGSGGFGEVILAYDRRWQTVAVKRLHKLTQDAAERFFREIRILSGLSSPYIVSIRETALDPNGVPYYIMEYCPGGPLRKWVEERHHWKDVAGVILHASLGLKTLHDLGGFHRDIKPDNILLASVPDGVVAKLSDFGLARIPDPNTVLTANAAGTHGYIAPEVLKGSNFTPAADIYSLGMTALELLTGGFDLDALASTDAPSSIKKLIGRMIGQSRSERPAVDEVIQTLRGSFQPAEPPGQDTQEGQDTKEASIWPWLLGIGVFVLTTAAVIAAVADNRKS